MVAAILPAVATNQMRREAAKRKLKSQQERRVVLAKRRQRTALITSVAVVVLVVGGIIAFTALSSGPDQPDPAAAPTSDAAAPTADPAAAAVTPAAIPTEVAALPVRTAPLPDPSTCDYPTDGTEPAKPVQPPAGTDVPASGTVAVTLTTSAGTVPLTLDRALAPCTVNSFVSLAGQGFFDASPCHRLTTDPGLQVLQCGDPTGTGTSGPGYTVPDEVFPELTYGRGILAMANTGSPNSGGSQFFMVYGDGQLPPQYTAFGSIDAAGLEVVDAAARAGHDGAFDPSPGGGAPVQPVLIESVTIA